MNLNSKTKLLTGFALSLAFVLFMMSNLAGNMLFKAVRWDLTADKLYTLSSGSKEIIDQLSEPVILRLYFSKNLGKVNPYMVSLAGRVEDLLTQYARASNGKIIFESIDPEPFSLAEDEALSYGLQGIPMDNTGTDLYFGLVGINSVDVKQVIPFLMPAREVNLEYDISQMLYKLSNPKPAAVGVLSSLPIDGAMGRPWAIWQQMQQQFQLELLEPDVQQIPASINTMLLINPAQFSDAALQAIDQFVMRGGKVLAFIDPMIEVNGSSGETPDISDKYTAFSTLLATWGVKYDPNKVVADRSQAKQVVIQDQGREQLINYPLWMDYTENNFDANDVITSSLDRITMASPGALSKIDLSNVQFTPLITSSTDALLIDKDQVSAVQQDIPTFLADYKPSGQYVLAARISGPVSSAFSDASVKDANIVIVADVDMLHDHFWINLQNVMGQDLGVPNSGNGNFVLGALDNLSGSNALISIRNRGTFVRPFTRLQKLQIVSQQRYHATEQTLQQKLQDIKRQLADTENPAVDVDGFKQQLIATRRELREVKRELNRDISNVESVAKFFTIGFVPLLILIVGIWFWGFKARRNAA